MVLSLFSKEPEVKNICTDIELEYVCTNCGYHNPKLIEQFVKRFKDGQTWVDRKRIAVTKELIAKALKVPSDGQQALQEKGRPSKFKILVIKITERSSRRG